jgi:hypothetical protein
VLFRRFALRLKVLPELVLYAAAVLARGLSWSCQQAFGYNGVAEQVGSLRRAVQR